jgi:glyoxylase-like metal-dependent hydrolase (beta-lactamase superfamily II)
MGTQIAYTPLYGAMSDGPLCGLLEVRPLPPALSWQTRFCCPESARWHLEGPPVRTCVDPGSPCEECRPRLLQTAPRPGGGRGRAPRAARSPKQGGHRQVNGFRLLLDCGWDDAYDPGLLRPLEALLPSLDGVIVSHPDPAHLGALPYLVRTPACPAAPGGLSPPPLPPHALGHCMRPRARAAAGGPAARRMFVLTPA